MQIYSPKINPDTDFAHFEKLKSAYQCLKKNDCRNEYTRYGSGIQLNDPAQDFKMDWRLGFTVAFYVLFAFVHGSLTSQSMKPGLRVGMGLGIMFCMSEVQLLQDVQATILDGQVPNKSIATLLSIFPSTYCAFEVIVLLRTTFFLFFGVICANSLCFEIDESTLRIYYGNKLVSQQKSITNFLQAIYNQHSWIQPMTKLNLAVEMQKVEYRKTGFYAL